MDDPYKLSNDARKRFDVSSGITVHDGFPNRLKLGIFSLPRAKLSIWLYPIEIPWPDLQPIAMDLSETLILFRGWLTVSLVPFDL
jgi:hypothetical protein